MSLINIEGLDRTGKSTVAKYFETLGFQIIHFNAPSQGTTPDEYLQQTIDLISSASIKDIVLDRGPYGELIWPQIFGRKSLLSEDDIDAIREVEESVGVQRIWMTDDNLNAHWQRCVDNKEPLDKGQFARARGLYSSMAAKYGFEKVTLQTFTKQFPDIQAIIDKEQAKSLETKTYQTLGPGTDGSYTTTEIDISQQTNSSTNAKHIAGKSPEQHKLEVANAINDILSKRILKVKGTIYDDIENEVRHFLNSKLGKLLGGGNSTETSFTQDEIKFYKTMFKKATKGEN